MSGSCSRLLFSRYLLFVISFFNFEYNMHLTRLPRVLGVITFSTWKSVLSSLPISQSAVDDESLSISWALCFVTRFDKLWDIAGSFSNNGSQWKSRSISRSSWSNKIARRPMCINFSFVHFAEKGLRSMAWIYSKTWWNSSELKILLWKRKATESKTLSLRVLLSE